MNKPIATIDLSLVKSVIDDQAPGRERTDDDETQFLTRSFRLSFDSSAEIDDDIIFQVDTDEEKAKWSVLNGS